MRPVPRLPQGVPSGKGLVPVTVEADPRGEGDTPCSAYYDTRLRRIVVQSDLAPIDQWCAVFHEAVHMVITDTDIDLSADQEERVCVALSNWLVLQALDPRPILRLALPRLRAAAAPCP